MSASIACPNGHTIDPAVLNGQTPQRCPTCASPLQQSTSDVVDEDAAFAAMIARDRKVVEKRRRLRQRQRTALEARTQQEEHQGKVDQRTMVAWKACLMMLSAIAAIAFLALLIFIWREMNGR